MITLKSTLFVNKISLNVVKHNYNNVISNRLLNRCRSLATAVPIKDRKEEFQERSLDHLLEKYEDKILYNCVLEKSKIKLGYRRNKALEDMIRKEELAKERRLRGIEPIPLALRLQDTGANKIENELHNTAMIKNEQIVNFPYESHSTISSIEQEELIEDNNIHKDIKKEIDLRHSTYVPQEFNQWMQNYENYNEEPTEIEEWKINYGTPDPNSEISNVPCGGCGALLHCKDAAIPGYLPSEIYKNYHSRDGQHLKAMICQRCHFLKDYNYALQVRVSPESYPKVLEVIKSQKALVIMMIDLLDFPCSIWPNIMDIIGNKRPIVIVGNKVDLLPKDSKGFLDHITQILKKSVQQSSLAQANIKHVSLISAKTGFGVEELITKLHNCWEYKGDVYLIGCTNVGKSTLFNALLQSDYCKVQAEDLIQRATTSQWPGTTLNLLKFPILRPSGWRLHVRTKRLISMNRLKASENQLRKFQLRETKNPKYATLIGHIERTFTKEQPENEVQDPFSVAGHPNASGKVRMGINERDAVYATSKWCYDTPGVVQPDQVLHLLTTEELMITLPKQLIRPKTFSITPQSSVFLGGLGRLDFLTGPISIRITVFASDSLPITICRLDDADELYKNLVGTKVFQVPTGNSDRLAQWPNLESCEPFKIAGFDWEVSCKDILLSSAGWISVTFGHKYEATFKAWTPEKRGIYLREPLLPRAVQLRGRRLRYSPSYRSNNFYVK